MPAGGREVIFCTFIYFLYSEMVREASGIFLHADRMHLRTLQTAVPPSHFQRIIGYIANQAIVVEILLFNPIWINCHFENVLAGRQIGDIDPLAIQIVQIIIPTASRNSLRCSVAIVLLVSRLVTAVISQTKAGLKQYSQSKVC